MTVSLKGRWIYFGLSKRFGATADEDVPWTLKRFCKPVGAGTINDVPLDGIISASCENVTAVINFRAIWASAGAMSDGIPKIHGRRNRVESKIIKLKLLLRGCPQAPWQLERPCGIDRKPKIGHGKPTPAKLRLDIPRCVFPRSPGRKPRIICEYVNDTIHCFSLSSFQTENVAQLCVSPPRCNGLYISHYCLPFVRNRLWNESESRGTRRRGAPTVTLTYSQAFASSTNRCKSLQNAMGALACVRNPSII